MSQFKSLKWTKSSSANANSSEQSSAPSQLVSYGNNKLIRKPSAAPASVTKTPPQLSSITSKPAAPARVNSIAAAPPPSVPASSKPPPPVSSRYHYVRTPSAASTTPPAPPTQSIPTPKLLTPTANPTPPNPAAQPNSAGPILRFSYSKSTAAAAASYKPHYPPYRQPQWPARASSSGTHYRKAGNVKLFPSSASSTHPPPPRTPNRISAYVSNKLHQRRMMAIAAKGHNMTLNPKKRPLASSGGKKKSSTPSKPASSSAPISSSAGSSGSKSRRVLIGGVAYAIDPSGRALKKVATPSTPTATTLGAPKRATSFVPNRVSIGGVTYTKSATGNTLIRKRAPASTSSSLGKKKRDAAAAHTQCLFFSRFGKCKRGATCKYLHDPAKVSICRKFLKGECFEKDCPLSHKRSAKAQSMPVCSFFLKGMCTNENCPYAHVKVSPDADVCQAFLAGFCPDGDSCEKLHTDECQAFKRTGSCPLGSSCKLKHIEKQEKKRTKSEGGGSEKKKIRKEAPLDSDDKLMLHDSASRLDATPAPAKASLASLMIHAGSIRPSFTSEVSNNTTPAAAVVANGEEAPAVPGEMASANEEDLVDGEEEDAEKEEEQSSSGSDQRS